MNNAFKNFRKKLEEHKLDGNYYMNQNHRFVNMEYFS